jgi:hypothetical protein
MTEIPAQLLRRAQAARQRAIEELREPPRIPAPLGEGSRVGESQILSSRADPPAGKDFEGGQLDANEAAKAVRIVMESLGLNPSENTEVQEDAIDLGPVTNIFGPPSRHADWIEVMMIGGGKRLINCRNIVDIQEVNGGCRINVLQSVQTGAAQDYFTVKNLILGG